MTTNLKQRKIGFIGAGNIARSVVGGLLSSGVLQKQLMVADPMQDTRRTNEELFGIKTTENNAECADWADTLVLAMKPQDTLRALDGLQDQMGDPHDLIISVAAGVTTTQIAELFAPGAAVVRVMPNTPALIGLGASGLFANSATNEEQRSIADAVMRAVGIVQWVDDESHMDIVTALSGSGPAYFFLLLEMMQKAAVTLGLPPDIAAKLNIQTGLGACHMAGESEDSVARLREKVTSPNGTTAAALAVLEAAGLEDTFYRAINAATLRGREMSKALEDSKS